MPEDQEPEIEDDQEPGEGPDPLRQARQAHKRAEKRAKELESQLSEAERVRRENVMLRAGVDIDSPVGQLILRGYEGELDVDAVRKYAADIPGATRGDEPPAASPAESAPPDDGPTPGELQAQRSSRDLQAQSMPPGAEPEMHPLDAAMQAGRRAGPPGSERAFGAYMDQLMEGVQRGDPRVVNQGVPSMAKNEEWHNQGVERQLANRERQVRR